MSLDQRSDNSPLRGQHGIVPSGLLEGTDIIALGFDGEGDLIWAANLPSAETAPLFAKRLLKSSVSSISSRTIADMVHSVTASGKRSKEVCEIMVAGERTFYQVDVANCDDGSIRVVMVDITEEQDRREGIRSFGLELAHRTKNVLAVVQSLANQISRRSTSYEQFRSRFLGQIEALSTAHDLIASTEWAGAEINDIVMSQIHIPQSKIAITIDSRVGTLLLKPNGVQNLGIIFRELQATCDESSVVSCHLDGIERGSVELVWTCSQPRETDIWEEMLVTYAPTSLDGTGRIVFDEERGLEYRLTIGAGQFVSA